MGTPTTQGIGSSLEEVKVEHKGNEKMIRMNLREAG